MLSLDTKQADLPLSLLAVSPNKLRAGSKKSDVTVINDGSGAFSYDFQKVKKIYRVRVI